MSACVDEIPATADKLGAVRSDIVIEIKSKLRLTRIVYLPQLALMALVSIAVMLVAGWGVWASISHLREPSINDLKSLVGYLTTGSSGFLGAVLIPVFKRVSEMSHSYLHLETKFSQALVQARHAETKLQIINAAKLNLLRAEFLNETERRQFSATKSLAVTFAHADSREIMLCDTL